MDVFGALGFSCLKPGSTGKGEGRPTFAGGKSEPGTASGGRKPPAQPGVRILLNPVQPGTRLNHLGKNSVGFFCSY